MIVLELPQFKPYGKKGMLAYEYNEFQRGEGGEKGGGGGGVGSQKPKFVKQRTKPKCSCGGGVERFLEQHDERGQNLKQPVLSVKQGRKRGSYT